MAGIEADEFNALAKLLRATSAEAIPVAENAAAKVYQSAIAAAAPRKTGQLASSIKVIEGKPQKTLTGDTRNRLFVGPEKKKGFYGYFREKGRKGFELKPRKAKALTWIEGMRAFYAKKVQVGPEPAKPWFEPAVQRADSQAVQAAETAFNAKLEELNAKG